jgi:hypothetical protein
LKPRPRQRGPEGLPRRLGVLGRRAWAGPGRPAVQAVHDPDDQRRGLDLETDFARRDPAGAVRRGAFARGACLKVTGGGHAWIGGGGARASRVFRTLDRGRTWTVHDMPVRVGRPSTDIFFLAFCDAVTTGLPPGEITRSRVRRATSLPSPRTGGCR